MDDVRVLIANEIPHLRRYALVLTSDSAAADDLVQDCLERAIRKRHLWTRRGSLRSWLYRILYNVFANQGARRARRRRETALEATHADPPQRPDQEDRVVLGEISRAMMRLPADQRAAIALTALEGLSYDEAASALGVPVGTLRSRLSRGRETLRRIHIAGSTRNHLRRVK